MSATFSPANLPHAHPTHMLKIPIITREKKIIESRKKTWKDPDIKKKTTEYGRTYPKSLKILLIQKISFFTAKLKLRFIKRAIFDPRCTLGMNRHSLKLGQSPTCVILAIGPFYFIIFIIMLFGMLGICC